MNIVKKAYCRSFQKVFKIALPILPYRTPAVMHSVKEIPEELKKLRVKRVLIVTDHFLYSSGVTRELENVLMRAHVEFVIYDKTVANPTTTNIEEARKLYLKNQCKALIGFGGGSSIDCAKAVGARVANPRKSLSRMSGILKVRRKLPPLFAIPTTAGTGSETTLAAVITDPVSRHKYPINDFPLIPRYAVLDPEVTRSLPPALTATTGMDALTHAVEAYIGGSTTAETRAWAIEAVKLIFKYVERAYRDGNDMHARRGMLKAAYQAGNAFSQSYVGYVHAVAHSLGGAYNIPHGLANSVLLPIVLEAYGTAAAKKLHELSVAVGLSNTQESDAAGAEKFIKEIRAMNERMNIPTSLQGIDAKDIPKLARYADAEANPLYPVPVLWDAGQLERFYYSVME